MRPNIGETPARRPDVGRHDMPVLLALLRGGLLRAARQGGQGAAHRGCKADRGCSRCPGDRRRGGRALRPEGGRHAGRPCDDDRRRADPACALRGPPAGCACPDPRTGAEASRAQGRAQPRRHGPDRGPQGQGGGAEQAGALLREPEQPPGNAVPAQGKGQEARRGDRQVVPQERRDGRADRPSRGPQGLLAPRKGRQDRRVRPRRQLRPLRLGHGRPVRRRRQDVPRVRRGWHERPDQHMAAQALRRVPQLLGGDGAPRRAGHRGHVLRGRRAGQVRRAVPGARRRQGGGRSPRAAVLVRDGRQLPVERPKGRRAQARALYGTARGSPARIRLRPRRRDAPPSRRLRRQGVRVGRILPVGGHDHLPQVPVEGHFRRRAPVPARDGRRRGRLRRVRWHLSGDTALLEAHHQQPKGGRRARVRPRGRERPPAVQPALRPVRAHQGKGHGLRV